MITDAFAALRVLTEIDIEYCLFPDGLLPLHVLVKKLRNLRCLRITVLDLYGSDLKTPGLMAELVELGALAIKSRGGMCPLKIECEDLGDHNEEIQELEEELWVIEQVEEFKRLWGRMRNLLLMQLFEADMEMPSVTIEFSVDS